MNVVDVMQLCLRAAGLSDPVSDIAQLMKSEGLVCLPVVSQGKVVGVVESRTLVQRCVARNHDPSYCSILNHLMVQRETAHPDMDVANAAVFMIDRGLDYLPVLEYGDVIGVVSLTMLRDALKEERSIALALDLWNRAVERISLVERHVQA